MGNSFVGRVSGNMPNSLLGKHIVFDNDDLKMMRLNFLSYLLSFF